MAALDIVQSAPIPGRSYHSVCAVASVPVVAGAAELVALSVVAAGADDVGAVSVVLVVDDVASVVIVDAVEEVTDEMALVLLTASFVTDAADETESVDDMLLVSSVVTGSIARVEPEEAEDTEETEDSEDAEEIDVSAPSVSDDPVIAARSCAASSVTFVMYSLGTTRSGGVRSVFHRKSILRSG